MSDIVERLRGSGPVPSMFAVREAADEIERLRAELAAKTERVKWFEDAGGVAMATRLFQVEAERDGLRELLRESKRWLDDYYIINDKLRDELVEQDKTIALLREQVRLLRAELENSRGVVKDICAEWHEDCEPCCDSFGHAKNCRATNIATAKRALNEEVVRLRAELAEKNDALQFVERWANHHAQQPSCTAEDALSVIQHYPPILEITRSYADGKVPDTPNPWAERNELETALNVREDEMSGLRAELAAAVKAHMATIDERDRLRELLREAKPWLSPDEHSPPKLDDLYRRIDAALKEKPSADQL